MLQLRENKTNLITLFLFILIAYSFSVGIRFLWISEMGAYSQFYWNNELMINTNDGYLFAEGARDLLSGTHQPNDLSGIDSSLAKLTALLASVLPFSFETLILHMPSFIGSLIVIPMILIGRALNQTTLGFIAALIAGVAHSYYNRTMAGYYDTDMLNVVFPVLEMYSLILAFTHQRNRYLIPITISITLYQWWYLQAYALDTALLVMILAYTVTFERKNLYLYKIALFMLIGIIALPIWIKLALAIAVFGWFHFQDTLSKKLFWPLFGIFVGIYFYTGGIDLIVSLLKLYVFRGETAVAPAAAALSFYDVISTVREAGHIPFTVFAERISGHPITFLLSGIGYILALIAYRPLLLTLPLAGLGFLALSGGLRFTIYAVPVMAIGFAFLLLWATQTIGKAWLRYAALFAITGAALYPNYLHVREYMTPTVMTAQEVSVLDRLGRIATREDYVVTWWDYGYPIRYYSDVKTWIDGGKHNGDVNYPASYVLTTQDPFSAAHMMRLFTEYTEKGYSDIHKNAPTDFEYMMKSEGFGDPDEFLTAISLPEYKLPAKSRDVYLYLPWRMIDILPTVTLFSNLDLKNSKEIRQQPFLYATPSFRENDKTVELGNGIAIDKTKNSLKINDQEVPIKSVFQVGYDTNQKLQINEQHLSSEGLNIIVMGSYGRFLVLDDFYLRSTYIQMFVFERYDRNLFEPVILDPMSKIYRLKV